MSRRMPVQKPGKSVQSVGTPPEFLRAVKSFLGIEDFVIDLAADRHNRVTERYYSERHSAFHNEWYIEPGWNWCNPPFSAIRPWVQRAYTESRPTINEPPAQTAVLIPASVGSNWWRDWVHNKAMVLFLNGRLTFVGHPTCYPKDLALLLYSSQWVPGYDIWSWKETV